MKKILCACLVIAMLVTLTACGGKDGEKTSGESGQHPQAQPLQIL